MTPRLKQMNAKEVIRLIKQVGFKQVDQTGSHAKFVNDEGKTIIIPLHKGRDIGRGLMRKILKQAGIEYEEG